MNDTFCVLPFIHAVYNPYDPNKEKGRILPCCRFNSRASVETEDVNDPLENSELFKKIQHELSNGIKSVGCERCWKDENIGEESYRQGSNRHFKHLIDSGQYKEKKLRYLEITPSNLCNLACRSCSSNFSSKWVPIDNFIASDRQKKSVAFTDWTTLDLSNLIELKLMGGEPMMLESNRRLLKFLQEKNKLKDIHLHFITNLTKSLSDEWKELLMECRRVSIFVSIDGIGNLNEYIRSGSSWKTTEKNLLSIIEFSKVNTSIIVSSNSVISLFNVNKTLELESYFQKLGIRYFLDTTSFPTHIDCKILPDSIKNKLIEIGVPKLIEKNLLEKKENPKIVQNFFDNIDKLDRYHKKHFREYNPEMYELLAEYWSQHFSSGVWKSDD